MKSPCKLLTAKLKVNLKIYNVIVQTRLIGTEFTSAIAASEAKASEGQKLIAEREKQVGMSLTSKERKAKVEAIERAKYNQAWCRFF